MTQDSLFISQENMHGGQNTMRANISGSPGYLQTNNSSAFRTVKKEDVLLNQSSVAGEKESSCQRIFKPSQRNKVIMTRSVDQHNTDRDYLGLQAHNSIFGVSKVTAKMHINNNTTLELVDPTVPKF